MQAEPVRIGVIGAGWWAAENHLPVLCAHRGVELYGVCGLNPAQLRDLQAHFDIPFATADYRELLSVPGLDAVVVSSPHHLHFEHARAALESGLDVLCEKPMCLRAGEAHELRRLAAERGAHFLIPYAWNYIGLADEAARLLREGGVGEPIHVQCHMASALRDLFSGEAAWFAENASVKPELETWSNPALGGGFAHGQLTHALGLLFRIAPLAAEEVYCTVFRSPTGADLSLALACRFRGGATGSIGGSGALPPGSTFQVDLRVFGSEGTLLLDSERPRLELRRFDGRNRQVETDMAPGAYPQAAPVEVFVDLVRGRPAENRSDATVGARVVEVLDAALRSAAAGGAARVEHAV